MQKVAAAAVFLSSFLAFGLVASAQSSETSLAITPAIIDAPVEAGSSVPKKIQVTNNGEQALPISIEAQSANIDGTALNQRGEDRFDVSSWVSFSQDVIVFEAGETKTIEFSVTAPFTALAGGHYAQLSLRALQLEDAGAIDLVLPEIAVPLLVTVPGEIIEEMMVPSLTIPGFSSPGTSMQTMFNVENTGTVHNLVSGQLVFARGDRVVTRFPIKPSVVLPDTSKEIAVEWEVPDHGVYDVFVELSYGAQRRTAVSPVQTLIVTPPLHQLLVLAAATWAVLYLYPKRHNIVAALRAVATARAE